MDKIKTHKTCGGCKNGELIDFVCTKKDIAVCIDDTCEDFTPKNSVVEKLEAAAKKCATTGNRSDLQAYLKLRKELLQSKGGEQNSKV